MLTLKKDGVLVETKWNGDIGDYEDHDVTPYAPRYLFEVCELDDDIVLADVFMLLNLHLEVFDLVLGNHCEEIVTEGLLGEWGSVEGIDYLELYWNFGSEIYDSKERVDGLAFPEFHGWGDWDDEHFLEGTKGSIGVSFCKANTLMNIPLKLKDDMQLCRENYDEMMKEVDVQAELKGMSYTLGHILYGILWELSWHGGPEKRDAAHERMMGTVTKAKENVNNLMDEFVKYNGGTEVDGTSSDSLKEDLTSSFNELWE